MADQEFLIMIRVKVSDLSLAERMEDADDEECGASELPGVEDLDPHALADMISCAVTNAEDLFAGSMIWAKVDEVSVVSADVADLADDEEA